MSSKCSKGKIYRKGYIRKVHNSNKYIRIKPNCILAQSQSGKKMVDINKKIMSLKRTSHKLARQTFGTPKCSKGEILREGYIRRSYKRSNSKNIIGPTIVAPTCIQSRTGKSHGKELFLPPEKGVLGEFNYHDVVNMSLSKRHQSLKKALLKIKPLSLARRLNALYLLNRTTNKKASKIFKEDEQWLKTTDEYINRAN
jgi:hypothetical protein